MSPAGLHGDQHKPPPIQIVLSHQQPATPTRLPIRSVTCHPKTFALFHGRCADACLHPTNLRHKYVKIWSPPSRFTTLQMNSISGFFVEYQAVKNQHQRRSTKRLKPVHVPKMLLCILCLPLPSSAILQSPILFNILNQKEQYLHHSIQQQKLELTSSNMASNRSKRMPKANVMLASIREETDKLEASARGASARSIEIKGVQAQEVSRIRRRLDF